MNDKNSIAIIGASNGQKILYQKAKEAGLFVVGFACDRGVLNEGEYDEFYDISVTDTDLIVDVCRNLRVRGVVTNASEFLIPIASEIAEKLGLVCTAAETIRTIQNKKRVRNLTKDISGLSQPKNFLLSDLSSINFPCVVKPIKGASKKGVSFCENETDLAKAIRYADVRTGEILIEEYIPGREFSVESLSFKGQHHIVQITDKENSGPPHFVELSHHQPSTLPTSVKDRICACVIRILDSVAFENGATHIEMKYDEKTDSLYLVEVNCRGGGDHISDTLVSLSTDCDYVMEMINIATDRYVHKDFSNIGYSGICYLTKQSRGILKYFSEPAPDWIVRSEKKDDEISEATSNYDRNGYFIYKSPQPIEL